MSMLAEGNPPIRSSMAVSGAITATTLTTTGAIACTTIDTGQGANEVHDMDQPLLTGSSPAFAGLTCPSISSTVATSLSSSFAGASAVVIEASNAAGGLDIRCGTGGLRIGHEADTSTIGIGDVVPTTSRFITLGGGLIATAVADTIDIGVDGASDLNAVRTVSIAGGNYSNGSQLAVNVAGGNLTDAGGSHLVSISAGTGIAGAYKQVLIGNTDGLTDMTVRSPRFTGAGVGPHMLNTTRGRVTFTTVGTAIGGTSLLVVSNSSCAATSGVQASLANTGTQDARMYVTGVIPAAGSFTVYATNSGTQQLNGDIMLSFELYN